MAPTHPHLNAAAIRLDSVHAAVAVPNWIVLLEDTDPMLRERAAISRGVIGDPRAIDALGQALRDPEAASGSTPPRRLRRSRSDQQMRATGWTHRLIRVDRSIGPAMPG